MQRLARVTLSAPAARLPELAAFYRDGLGLPDAEGGHAVGPDVLTFAAAPGEPFHHFALLVGDLDAARSRVPVELLPNRRSGEEVFDFPAWDARAIYFHDPAGSIVELIQHGPAGDDELLGISEAGVVAADPLAAVGEWERRGAPLWDGGIADDGTGLAFCGRQAHTVIVAPEGRGWLPTGRPAEVHPVEIELA